MKFKVGDRVRVYGPKWNKTSVLVSNVSEDGWMYVDVNGEDGLETYRVHEKQCRRVKPKARIKLGEKTCYALVSKFTNLVTYLFAKKAAAEKFIETHNIRSSHKLVKFIEVIEE